MLCTAPFACIFVAIIGGAVCDYFEKRKFKKLAEEMRKEKEKRMEDLIILSERFFNTSSHSLSRFFKD